MTRCYGILAYPAKHSLSPVMHNAYFKHDGINAEYLKYEIQPEQFLSFIKKIRKIPIWGLSVSVPYKERIIPFLDRIDIHSKKIGAVNTVLNKDGVLYGYNTDYLGFNNALKESAGAVVNKTVHVFGAGGASRAVVYGLLKEGAKVSIFNRTARKAEKLSDYFSGMFGVPVLYGSSSDLCRSPKADIFIQASSIWLQVDRSKNPIAKTFSSSDFASGYSIIMDIVYDPLITPLLKVGLDLGKTVISGEKMLLHQALKQAEIFTGKNPSIRVMRNALLKAIAGSRVKE